MSLQEASQDLVPSLNNAPTASALSGFNVHEVLRKFIGDADARKVMVKVKSSREMNELVDTVRKLAECLKLGMTHPSFLTEAHIKGGDWLALKRFLWVIDETQTKAMNPKAPITPVLQKLVSDIATYGCFSSPVPEIANALFQRHWPFLPMPSSSVTTTLVSNSSLEKEDSAMRDSESETSSALPHVLQPSPTQSAGQSATQGVAGVAMQRTSFVRTPGLTKKAATLQQRFQPEGTVSKRSQDRIWATRAGKTQLRTRRFIEANAKLNKANGKLKAESAMYRKHASDNYDIAAKLDKLRNQDIEEKNEFETKANKFRDQRDSLQRDLDALKQDHNALKHLDYASLRLNYDALKQEYDALKDCDYEGLKCEYNTLSCNYNTLKSNFNESERLKMLAEAKTSALEDDMKKLREDHAKDMTQLEVDFNKKAEKFKTLTDPTNELISVKRKLKEFEDRVAAKVAINNAPKLHNDTFSTPSVQGQQVQDELQRKIGGLDYEVSMLKKQYSLAAQTNLDRLGEIATLRMEKITERREHRKELLARSAAADKAIAKLKKTNNILLVTTKELEKNLEMMAEKCRVRVSAPQKTTATVAPVLSSKPQVTLSIADGVSDDAEIGEPGSLFNMATIPKMPGGFVEDSPPSVDYPLCTTSLASKITTASPYLQNKIATSAKSVATSILSSPIAFFMIFLVFLSFLAGCCITFFNGNEDGLGTKVITLAATFVAIQALPTIRHWLWKKMEDYRDRGFR